MSAKKDYMLHDINSLYQKGFSITAISKMLPVSRQTISRILRENDINIKYSDAFDRKYETCNIGYSPYINRLKHTNYKKNLGRSKVFIDFAFFNSFSHELAYVLGWMITDGNIFLKSRRVSLTLKDIEHLNNIFSLFSYGYEVAIYKPTQSITSYGTISICNEDLCKSFMKYGIYPNKTHTCDMPYIPDEYVRDFVRGVFEGDGCFSIKNDSKTSSIIEITSASRDFLESLGKSVQKQTGLLYSITKSYKDKSMKLTYRQQDAIKTFFEFIYSGVPSVMILERKYAKMKAHIESVVKNNEQQVWSTDKRPTSKNQQAS